MTRASSRTIRRAFDYILQLKVSYIMSDIKTQTTRIRQALTTGTYDVKQCLDACDELDKLADQDPKAGPASLGQSLGFAPNPAPKTDASPPAAGMVSGSPA